MRKLIAVITIPCLFVTSSSFTGAVTKGKEIAVSLPVIANFTKADLIYQSLNLEQKGLSRKAFDLAWKGYQKLQQKGKIFENKHLVICDFSQSSKQKRLYVIDVASQELLVQTYVAHGRNSGLEYATRFSNRPESLQSSLGFYVTRNTYFGQHGLSLRMDGLEPGFNDKAFKRAIVIHGADYIGAKRLNRTSYMGRSFGCPAIPAEESKNIIETIKDGSCLFIYHPSTNYLKGSKILND